jgi:hypothetical protein
MNLIGCAGHVSCARSNDGSKALPPIAAADAAEYLMNVRRPILRIFAPKALVLTAP